MKYCVIGGAGFIGSHVVDRLIEKGHEVVVLDNLISGVRELINKKAIFEWGDIRTPSDLDRVFKKYAFDRVINLAAQPYIPECFDDPELFFETNANGTLNVLRACERYKIPKMLQYASAEEIGPKKLRPWDIERLESDNTKIYSIVSYRAKTSFEEGLKKTIAYFREKGWHF